jgi:hypothetical protein
MASFASWARSLWLKCGVRRNFCVLWWVSILCFLESKSETVLGFRFRARNGLTSLLFVGNHIKSKQASPFRARNLRPKTVSLFGSKTHQNQAYAVWQWYECCAAQVPPGKTPLRINVDEASVCLYQGGRKGTIVSKRRRDPPAEEPCERAARAKRRQRTSLLVFFCVCVVLFLKICARDCS